MNKRQKKKLLKRCEICDRLLRTVKERRQGTSYANDKLKCCDQCFGEIQENWYDNSGDVCAIIDDYFEFIQEKEKIEWDI